MKTSFVPQVASLEIPDGRYSKMPLRGDQLQIIKNFQAFGRAEPGYRAFDGSLMVVEIVFEFSIVPDMLKNAPMFRRMDPSNKKVCFPIDLVFLTTHNSSIRFTTPLLTTAQFHVTKHSHPSPTIPIS